MGAAAEDEVDDGVEIVMAAAWLPVKTRRANVVDWLTVIADDSFTRLRRN